MDRVNEMLVAALYFVIEALESDLVSIGHDEFLTTRAQRPGAGRRSAWKRRVIGGFAACNGWAGTSRLYFTGGCLNSCNVIIHIPSRRFAFDVRLPVPGASTNSSRYSPPGEAMRMR